MAEIEEEIKSLLMKVKEDSEKAGLKLNIQKIKIMASRPITPWQIEGGEVETVADFIFLGSQITVDGDSSHEIQRCLPLGRKAMTNLDSILKSRDIADKGPYSQSYGFPSSHAWMWELDNKNCWVPKNWCFQTVMLEKTLESPLDSKEIKLVHPKGKLTLNIHWKDWCWSWSSSTLPPDAKIWLIGKDLDAGKEWRQEEKGTTENEMVDWHHQLNGHKFEQSPGNSEGQGSLACCSPWGLKQSDTTEWLNNFWK